jgi:hypothetical protein
MLPLPIHICPCQLGGSDAPGETPSGTHLERCAMIFETRGTSKRDWPPLLLDLASVPFPFKN